MAEQTSLVAQQVRLMHWAEQIRECQNRPEGMDVSTWCEQNNITKANYYYRLKRVRQMCLDQLPEAEKPAFVELPRLKAERTVHCNDFFFVVRTTSFANSVRHHKSTTFAAFYKVRSRHFPVCSSLIASCFGRFILRTDGHYVTPP